MSDDAYPSQQSPTAGSSEYNALHHIVTQLIGQIATATLVRVERVDTVAFRVDVTPLVALLDGAGNATPHGVIHDIPYVRVQGGVSALIIDPVVGDLGLVSFASHDISSVKANRAPSNPGSRRRYDWADGVYVGSVAGLSAVATQYVRVSGAGLRVEVPVGSAAGNLAVGTGASGSFGTTTGQTVTVRDGLITNIY